MYLFSCAKLITFKIYLINKLDVDMKYLEWGQCCNQEKVEISNVKLNEDDGTLVVGKILNKSLSLSIKYLIVYFEKIFKKFIYKF